MPNADFSVLVPKGSVGKVEKKVNLPSEVFAPIEKGEKLGEIEYTLDGHVIGRADICAAESVNKLSWGEILLRLLRVCFCAQN